MTTRLFKLRRTAVCPEHGGKILGDYWGLTAPSGAAKEGD
jgi:hypothetical protein